MRKALIFIFAISVVLLACSVQGANLLKNSQYEAIKTLNGAFFEEYKKLNEIQLRLIRLSSYDTANRYNDTFLDEAIDHVTFTMNLWNYEYRFVKWLPTIRDEFFLEYLCELAKSLELVKKKTLCRFNPVKATIIQLSQPKYTAPLDTDVLKELEDAQIAMEAGIKLLDRISAQFSADAMCSEDRRKK